MFSPQALTVNSSGTKTGELRYKAYGETRYTWGATPTTFNFTGQRLDSSTQLLYYGARYYDPLLGRFLSADTIVPSMGNPQALNRYAYMLNNPLKYTDPDGYRVNQDWQKPDPDVEVRKGNWVGISSEGDPTTYPAEWGCKGNPDSVWIAAAAPVVVPVVWVGGAYAVEAGIPWLAGQAATKAAPLLGPAWEAIKGWWDKVRGGSTSPQAQRYLQMLKDKGQIIVPRGEISTRIIGEISREARAEVGLFRLETGERVLTLGEAWSVEIPDGTVRVIAHTHPSGILQFSQGDINVLTSLGQGSSVLVDWLGKAMRVRVP